LKGFISKLKLKKVILLSYSWGGFLALNYALHYPEDLSFMIFLSPLAYPTYKRPSKGSYLVKLLQAPVAGIFLSLLLARTIGRYLIKGSILKSFMPQGVPYGYLEMSSKYIFSTRSFLPTLEDRDDFEKIVHRTSRRYPSISTPTFIFAGALDIVTTTESHSKPLSEALPHSKLIMLEETGHGIPQSHKDILKDYSGILPKDLSISKAEEKK